MRRRTPTRWQPPFRQSGDHGLKLIDQLQGALAGFCLVRRVSRHEFAAASEVPYGGGNVML